jgi:hypothetical protein
MEGGAAEEEVLRKEAAEQEADVEEFCGLIARLLNQATRQKADDKGGVGRNASRSNLEDNIATVARKWLSTVNVVIDTSAVNEHCCST